MSPIKRVAFIGMGNMGWPMAANLIHTGFDVAVNDVTLDRAANFAEEVGGRAASDAVVTILPTSKQVSEVIASVLPALAAAAMVIEISLAVPSVTRDLAGQVAAGGAVMIDCPVSGGVAQTETGELAILAGGKPDHIERATPLLNAVDTSIHRCGGVGAGQAMKALNNLVSAGGFLIGLEALLISQRFGLDPTLMVDVLNASTGMTNSSQKKFKQFVLSCRFDFGFGLDLMAKDLSIALGVGRDTATPTTFAALCRALPRDVGKCCGAVGAGPRPHGDGTIEREAGRHRAWWR